MDAVHQLVGICYLVIMSTPWRVNAETEAAKLSAKESDWNLAGLSTPPTTRTRHGGKSVILKKRKLFGEDSSSSSSEDESYSSDEDDDSESSESGGPAWDEMKPEHTRVIVETTALLEMVERNSICRECQGPVMAELQTVTLATSLVFKCCSEVCSYIDYGCSPAPALLPQYQEDNRERNTDYALNILYVVGFIANGDGPREASRLLGMLGLPNNDTTMESRSFGTIEDRIAPIVWDLFNQILLENLTEEIKASVDESAFNLWQQSIDKSNQFTLEVNNYPKVCVSYDMGWNQRGKMMNSPSGHAFLVGKYTRKAIMGEIKCKLCSFCESWQRKITKGSIAQGTPVGEHWCLKNHEGASVALVLFAWTMMHRRDKL
jgi:hypothetical protein